MSAPEIHSLLESLAEGLLLAEATDLQALAAVHGQLQQVEQWAVAEGKARAAEAASAAVGWLQQVILEETTEPEALLTLARASVMAIQAVAAGRVESEILWPQETSSEAMDTATAVDSTHDPGASASDQAASSYLDADQSLLSDFINEAREHLEASEVNLLKIESQADDADALNALFRAFHTIKGAAGFLGLDAVQSLAHAAETLLDKARDHRIVMAGMAIDVVFEAVDQMKHLVESLAATHTGAALPPPTGVLPRLLESIAQAAQEQTSKPTLAPQRLGEILVASNQVRPEQIEEALKSQLTTQDKPLGEILVASKAVPAQAVAKALRAQQAARQPGGVKEAIKVDADRLDRLVDLIGEMVIAEAMVSQNESLRRLLDDSSVRQLTHLDKITRELQETATSLRMVPLKSTFQKMARLVRDLARKSEKQVEFVTSGEDSELDKSVVDQINDPLLHMIRNAIDHGLEDSVEERRAAGKPPVGRVALRAYHKGSNIHIEVADDGRGLDRAAILRKARERGLLREDATPTDAELWNHIFQPGFSTARQVTDVSGRGVGMDVVRRNIESLRGQMDIRSERLRGTTFTVRLPLTLAIIDGMVVRVGEERFIVPTLSIVRAVRPKAHELSTAIGRGELLRLHGDLLPLFRLSRILAVRDAERDPENAIVLIVEEGGRLIALLADELLGQQQIVIKPLGGLLRETPGISGAAIMPDGNAGLIVDVGALMRIVEDEVSVVLT